MVWLHFSCSFHSFLLLIDTNIIDFIARGKNRAGRIAACRPADGQVYDDVMRLQERICTLGIPVECGRKIGIVQKRVVQVEPDALFIPIHPPYMELIRPTGGVQVGDGQTKVVPHGLPFLLRAPGDVGQNHTAVILHNIDLAAMRPVAAHAERPKSRPQPRTGIDPGAHFKSTKRPAMQSPGEQAGRGVFGVLAILLPVAAALAVIGIGLALALGLDDQHAVIAAGIFRLVPLQLLVTDETPLVAPVCGIGLTVCLELVGPDQLIVAGCILRRCNLIFAAGYGDEGQAARDRECVPFHVNSFTTE